MIVSRVGGIRVYEQIKVDVPEWNTSNGLMLPYEYMSDEEVKALSGPVKTTKLKGE